ncbi:ceroid-lipofuscinosis neuronal protein 5 [Lingula anatina]|uniref:Bis(monoacylglycero)phosphate synthase CLN5 n=1 Tax=Lingula anatina TaxID=7574 RepID=A0A1S3H035_LINAN|nr:ceroid-lipofuscinosis neuronal protein 5 [Lingula anatina]|eukprot:XP_013378841.1 ceroid-lipofuscinosis neuronal protein 5 [Lingula anatina]
MADRLSSSSRLLLFLAAMFAALVLTDGISWPVPYKRYNGRPKTDPYCQALFPFCPTGRGNGSMPKMQSSDIIEIYALKAPVFEFKFGDLLGKFNIIHDALGFKNTRTGLNYTMEWYELFELFNCTFPHVFQNDTMLWCNQGAACIYNGIDDIHWSQNGTLVKIGEMTGDQFSHFSTWALGDNTSSIYYETWTVEQEPGGKMWFEPHDCATWVKDAIVVLGKVGAKFNTSIHLNYTKIHLYSDEPQYLGNYSSIFGPNGNQTLAKDMLAFFKDFQAHQSFFHLLQSMFDAFDRVFEKRQFYLFYNFEYWLLKMKAPFFKLDYTYVPLPGQKKFP